MRDWKKEYKRLTTSVLLTIIALLFFIIIIIIQSNEIEQKEEKITIQQIEIIDLKEQIHLLKTKEV